MKKYLSLILAAILALSLSACSNTESGVSVKVTVSNTEDGISAELSERDSFYISELLANGTWSDATGDCINDCKVTIDDEEIYYHSDCGTFNDNKNQRNLALGKDAKEQVNEIFEKYVTLGLQE